MIKHTKHVPLGNIYYPTQPILKAKRPSKPFPKVDKTEKILLSDFQYELLTHLSKKADSTIALQHKLNLPFGTVARNLTLLSHKELIFNHHTQGTYEWYLTQYGKNIILGEIIHAK